ncbi:cytochrome P450 87A3-like isoform X2 [Panicum virgatum]|uniref:cytochrome P450 87A3-like isoform X2 n=1 Tax=Panicum virgatum TaxID=38727 RepID=UPI0019D5B6C2|nr:cytochrome P450 87A3-like isoform X2 [Panicum virgatum]
MDSLVCVAVWAVTLAMVMAFITWAYRWSHPKASGRLPPGSLGLPLLGETLQFFAPNPTCDVSPFVKERLNRYGNIFKTSIVGRSVVVSADPDLNYYVFQQEGKLFESWYPDTFTEIFGRDNVGSLHGFMYKYLKTLVLRLYGQENLRTVLLADTDGACRASLASWASRPSVELKDAISTMIFDLTAKKLISYEPSKSSENLRNNFVAFIRGLISFPVDIPGTAYHECMQGRKNAMKVLKKMMRERMADAGRQGEDFFDVLIEELRREKPVMTEAIALDLMFVLLFASFETTALALTLGVKLLAENPRVLRALTEEHEVIVRSRKDRDAGLTWAEYKSMTFTSQVILEIVRLANIVPGIFRKALQDIEFKGYTIPAGWGVMVCPPAVHLNPEIYEDPLAFDPWRWQQDKAEITGGTKQFMAFGGGLRFCVGTDLSKVLMATFIHSLVTKYSWRTIKGGNIVRTPGLSFPDGFHVQLFPKELTPSSVLNTACSV